MNLKEQNTNSQGLLFDLIKDAVLCIFMFGLVLLMHFAL